MSGFHYGEYMRTDTDLLNVKWDSIFKRCNKCWNIPPQICRTRFTFKVHLLQRNKLVRAWNDVLLFCLIVCSLSGCLFRASVRRFNAGNHPSQFKTGLKGRVLHLSWHPTDFSAKKFCYRNLLGESAGTEKI